MSTCTNLGAVLPVELEAEEDDKPWLKILVQEEGLGLQPYHTGSYFQYIWMEFPR